jgi:outer membrane protein assembly factor BamB
MSKVSRRIIAGVVALAAISVSALAADWPQWRGENRDGMAKETGLLKQWPEGGPKLLWKATNLGEGYASPSVAKGRVYGMGLRDEDEVVWALDDTNGKELWKTRIAGRITLDGGQGGYGPRGTPTVDGERIYAIGVGGKMVCLNTRDGKLIWQKDFVEDFGGSIPTWGYSESPLVDGANVIGSPGGRGAAIVAFNKVNGEVVWKANVPENDRAHYSSAILATVGGQKQIIQFLSGGVVGLEAATGKFLWRFDSPANRVANCSTPLFADNHVFAASAYNTGGALAKLTKTSSGTSAEQVYFTKRMQNHHGGMVLVGDHLYGFDNNTLTCLNFKTGEVAWADRSVGKGSVTYADGCIYARSERGPIALVEATPKGYVEKGRFEQPERTGNPSWTYPIVANGKLYLLDQNNLYCYDVKTK